ncbi:thiamine transporter ThiT [Companilactobacillus sp. RD055328]|uniref:energy-coupled thiamine transporter ThiT n=1 Tax=Companilactobacillus sp. RD055328 TaxID=2916634 RepID=UPI001FC8D6CF|nr:energy-coupled thiamine transporter ThiT [Companilactobacillus sp. RD055328]GKQ42856.1 thiamine transporter ThiT [Companilactobacillus sp. RD055328]
MEKTRGNSALQVTVEGAIIVAFAMALTYLPHTTGVSAVEFSYGLVPVTVFGFRRGFGPATLAGLTWGMLDLILRGLGNGGVLNPLQGFIEYFIAFALIGIAGLGSNLVQNNLRHKKNVIIPVILFGSLGVLGKYFMHFIAGGYYWGAYAPKGMNPWMWSLIVNGGSAVANIILVIVISLLLSSSFKRLLLPK